MAAPKGLVDVEFLDAPHALQHREPAERDLGRPGHVLQKQGQVLSAERAQHIPEPLDLLISGLIRGVLRVILEREPRMEGQRQEKSVSHNAGHCLTLGEIRTTAAYSVVQHNLRPIKSYKSTSNNKITTFTLPYFWYCYAPAGRLGRCLEAPR